MKEERVEKVLWGLNAKEYHQQVHGFKAFRNWHSGQYPGQILEMEDWKRFESKEMAFPAFARNVMYTMSFEVPSYFGSLTSSLSYVATIRDEQKVWYDEETRTVTLFSHPWAVLPVFGRIQCSKIYLSGVEVIGTDGTVGIKMVGHSLTHLEKAPFGMRKVMEMVICKELGKNFTGLHCVLSDYILAYVHRKKKDAHDPPDVAWYFEPSLDSDVDCYDDDWYDADSNVGDDDLEGYEGDLGQTFETQPKTAMPKRVDSESSSSISSSSDSSDGGNAFFPDYGDVSNKRRKIDQCSESSEDTLAAKPRRRLSSLFKNRLGKGAHGKTHARSHAEKTIPKGAVISDMPRKVKSLVRKASASLKGGKSAKMRRSSDASSPHGDEE